MKILVINAGSSSLKYQLIDMETEGVLAKGGCERIGIPGSLLKAKGNGKEITVDTINAAMKAASEKMPETYGYNEDMIVSSDVIGMTYGSLFDATQTMVTKVADDLYEVQVVSWYDNENSYTSQMVRTIKYFEKFVK